MPRFELDDGTVRRFWEISREGSVIAITTGALGTDGKKRVKDHRTEDRAKREEHNAIQQMTRLGYTEAVDAPDAVPEALASAMADRTDDRLRVLADWLQDQGDAWGPVLALGLVDPPQIGVLRDQIEPLERAWFPSPFVKARWDRGRIVELEVETDRDERRTAVEAFFRTPAGHLVDRLTLSGRYAHTVLDGLLEGGPLAGLRTLAVRHGHLDLPRVSPRLPALQRLSLQGATFVFGAPAMASLVEIDASLAGALSNETFGQAKHARLPSLEVFRVSAHGGLPRFGSAFAGMLAHTPLLRELSIRDLRVRGLLTHWAPGPELQVLTLEGCALDDRDGEALLRVMPGVHDATEIALDLNDFSGPVIEALEAWPQIAEIRVGEPDPYYEEVME